jgi:signal transduction histidine kinase
MKTVRVISILVVLLISSSCTVSELNGELELDEWSVSFGDSMEWIATDKTLFEISDLNDKTIFLKAAVPETGISDPVLFISNSYQSMEVFLDDLLIYSFGNVKKNDLRVSRYWHTVDLPENSAGSEILLKISSPVHLIGLSKHVFLGSSTEVYRDMVRNDLPKISIGLFLMFFGIAAVALTMYIKQFSYYSGLNSFIILFGIWLLFNPPTAQLFINNPSILYYADLPVLILSAASFLLFFSRFFIPSVKRIISALSILHFTAGVFLTLSDLFGIITIKQFGPAYLMLISNILIVALILFGTIEKRSEAKIIMTGAALFLILASIEIILFFNNMNMSAFGLDLSFVHIGGMVLVSFWIVLYFLRYVRMNRIYLESQENFSRDLLDFQNDERKRIAHELHDAAGHDFLVIKTLSQMGVNEPDKVDIYEILKNISETSENAVNNLRNVCRALYPPVIENLGLRKALLSLFEKSFGNTAISTDILIEDIDRFFEKTDHIHIYRIVQEIINNILKHSEAGHVSFSIKIISRSVLLKITDNGKGVSQNILDSPTGFSKGMGLKGIFERTKILGGKMTLRNIKPSGFVIGLEFKINQERNK